MIIQDLRFQEGTLTVIMKKGKELVSYSFNEEDILSCDSLSEEEKRVYSFLNALYSYAMESQEDEEELNELYIDHFSGRSLEEYEDPRGFLQELEEPSSSSPTSEDDDVFEDSWEGSARHYASSDMAEKKG